MWIAQGTAMSVIRRLAVVVRWRRSCRARQASCTHGASPPGSRRRPPSSIRRQRPRT
uniref:Uncharacterized protein n=1 Tax=Arundo donax TaxID=35708 RepID=A0A0A9G8N9_ARUDO